MKNINKYINERLHITSKQQYSCQPKTKDELREIIMQRIKEDGLDCDLNDIDVSKITDMSFLFNANEHWKSGNKIFKKFNGDISQWNVSNVKDMKCTFNWCEQFNCDLSEWNVSKVNDMNSMFCECKNFNQNLNKWNVSNVIDMESMFCFCRKFNCDLSKWNVSNVKNMELMFYNCEEFNCDISMWDVTNVMSIYGTFEKCENFNQNLDDWNIHDIFMVDAFKNCPTKPKWYNGK